MLSHEILQTDTKRSHSYHTSEMLKIRFLISKQIPRHTHKKGGITTVFTSHSSASWKIYENITVFELNKNKTFQDLFFSYVRQEVIYVSGVPTYLNFKFRNDAWHRVRLHYDLFMVCNIYVSYVEL